MSMDARALIAICVGICSFVSLNVLTELFNVPETVVLPATVVITVIATIAYIYSPYPSFFGFHIHGGKAHKMQKWGFTNEPRGDKK